MSEFSPEPETTRGGLDRYLGPTAASASTMPDALTPGGSEADADPAASPDTSGPLRDLAAAVQAKHSGPLQEHPTTNQHE